jgi:virginiamycin A acetyltransferase
MNTIISKIPVLRSIIRIYQKTKFDKQWRRKNPHNETIIGNRMFPMEIATVGKGSYGILTIQSLYVTPQEILEIGNYVSIAPEVTFLMGVNHQIDTATTYPFYSKLVQRSSIDASGKGSIIVEDEVWMGTGAMIFSGIRIGKGAIIAAGAIVTKDVPPYAIVGGNPAKLIRYRFSEDIIKILLPINFIDYPESWIKENIDLIYSKIETVSDALKLKEVTELYKKKK